MPKIMTKSSAHKSRHFMSEHKVSRKTDIFCVLREKDKKKSRKKPYCSTEICLFYTGPIKIRFSVKRLHEYKECRDVRTELFIRIFEVSKSS